MKALCWFLLCCLKILAKLNELSPTKNYPKKSPLKVIFTPGCGHITESLSTSVILWNACTHDQCALSITTARLLYLTANKQCLSFCETTARMRGQQQSKPDASEKQLRGNWMSHSICFPHATEMLISTKCCFCPSSYNSHVTERLSAEAATILC